MRVNTISLNLTCPVGVEMEVVQVSDDHIQGNLVMLKNEIYEIPIRDDSRSLNIGDKVSVNFDEPVKTNLQVPINIEKT